MKYSSLYVGACESDMEDTPHSSNIRMYDLYYRQPVLSVAGLSGKVVSGMQSVPKVLFCGLRTIVGFILHNIDTCASSSYMCTVLL